MERGSLCLRRVVKALSGTGVERAPTLPAFDEPPPELPDADARVVPASEVLALEEILDVVLVLERTVCVEVEVEEGASADVDAALGMAAVAVLMFPEARAEVDEAGVETPVVEEGVKRELPAEAAAPDPAPEDEPAVFDTGVVDALPVNEDWMYRSLSFCGLSWNLGSVSRMT